MGRRQYRSAIKDFDRAVEINPGFTVLYFNRGLARSNIGDHAGAISDYTRFLNVYPQNAAAYYHRSRACYRTDLLQKALLLRLR